MLTEDLLGNELKTLAGEPGPPMRLDLDRARVLGRRAKRRRTTAIAAVCVAVIVAAVAIPTAVRDDASQDHPADVVTSRSPNVLVARATFGWLPEDTVGVGFWDDAEGIYTIARGAGDFGTYTWLATHPATDSPPTFEYHSPLTLVPAPPVNGRPAYWATPNESDPLNDGDMRFVWRAANGQWASLRVYYLNTADPASVVYRIAADVTVADTPVAVPIRIDELPPAFEDPLSSLRRPAIFGSGPWEVEVAYRLEGATVFINVRPQGTTRPMNTVNPTKVCKTEAGLDICVESAHATSPTLTSMGGPQGLLDRITSLGMDESNWTTDPVS